MSLLQVPFVTGYHLAYCYLIIVDSRCRRVLLCWSAWARVGRGKGCGYGALYNSR